MSDNQGQFDSLCGVYAIINAINLIHKMRRRERRELFEHLLTILKKDKYLSIAIISGTYKRHMNLMLSAAIKHMHRQYEVSITATALYKSSKPIKADMFFERLENILRNKHSTVIINLMGVLNHWSCVRKVTHNSLLLEDSSGVHYVRKSSCYIGDEYKARHIIFPAETWQLTIER